MSKKTSNLNTWLQSKTLSLEDKKIIKNFSSYKKKQNFKNILQFGSSGVRRKIDLGSDCFNDYNMKVITLAIIKWLQEKKDFQNIFIGYDTRLKSEVIAKMIAKIFANFNYQVYLFSKNTPIPTPFLSYLLKNYPSKYHLGIMITASHNDYNYNGCKIFTKSGFALHFKEIKKINHFIKEKYATFLNQKIVKITNKIKYVAFEEKNNYLKKITRSFKENIFNNQKLNNQNIKILYSPLQGTGNNWTNLLLKQNNFSLQKLEEQCEIDPYFKKVNGKPNPENDQNFLNIFKKIKKINNKFDLVILNDGDCDRMRVAVNHQKKWKILNGNDIAIIFVNFLLENRHYKNNPYIFRSYVSTPLVDKIAKKFSCRIIKTKTGFSNLANEYQKINSKAFMFAFEESIGYLCDVNINNDKDGLQAALLISQITSYCKDKKITLIDYLEKIYQKFGYCESKTWKIKQKKQILTIDQKLTKDNLANQNWKTKFYYQKNKKDVFLHCIAIDKENKFWIRSSQTEPIKKIYYHHLTKRKTRKQNMKYEKIFFKYLLNKK